MKVQCRKFDYGDDTANQCEVDGCDNNVHLVLVIPIHEYINRAGVRKTRLCDFHANDVRISIEHFNLMKGINNEQVSNRRRHKR